MKKQSPRRLKVGLDLDGVILYNPARIIRPIVAAFKKIFLKKKKTSFYVPHSPFARFMWDIFHASSLYITSGFTDARTLAQEKKIDLYIITARYSFLTGGFEKFVTSVQGNTYLSGWYSNKKDEQPHLFKERMIRQFDIDIFVEDNYDIVTHLSKKFPDKKIMWICNVLDSNIDHPFKFRSLKQAIEKIKKWM